MVAISAATAPAGSGNRVDTSLDSAWLLMGKTTPLHIEVTTSAGSHGRLWAPGDTLVEGVEVASRTQPDTTDLGNGRIRISQTLVLQSFDSGNYVLPPILYIDGGDTARSQALALKVVPVNVDSLETIHDFAPVLDIKSHFWDWVPLIVSENMWAVWLLLGLIVAAFCLWYFYLRKLKDKPMVIPLKRHVYVPTPYEVAIQALNRLKEEDLCSRGEEKEFYTRLTEILRVYVDNRFHINAMEMTSSQILRALKSNEDTRLPEKYMRSVLQIADYVKFAKMRPFSDDNVQALRDAFNFVEETKPRPVAQEEPEATGSETKPISEDTK